MPYRDVNTGFHIPVLKDEVLEYLVTTPQGVYVDGTLGGGGHAECVIQKIFPTGTLIGIDADTDALKAAGERLKRFEPNLVLVHDNNSNIQAILRSRNIPAIHGLLLDLGVSSFQLDEPGKGFSFRGNDALDMRMDRRQALDAKTIVNSYAEEELAEIFWKFGEERNARRIARDIVESRRKWPIGTTVQLADIVGKRIHEPFLTKSLARVFQALRIEVNNELTQLVRVLESAATVLIGGGRIVVISYHSLEDRIVKNFFQKNSATIIPSGHKLVPDTPIVPTFAVLTKKPIVASPEERALNPRARSAKMRVAQKI